MNKEEKLLISICSSYINGQEIKAEENIDYQRLFKLSMHHNLLGVLHCAINNSKEKNIFPKEFCVAVKEGFYDYVYRAELQGRALCELEQVMEGTDIKYALFKGAVLRELYPVKESRAMGDIDLLISKESIPKAKQALCKAGYKCTAENGNVHDYRKDGILLEVHNALFDDGLEKAFYDAFENAEFSGCKGCFTPSYHLAYLIAHTAHHFKYYGAGIRLILDLAVLQKNCEIDYNKAFEILDRANLRKFAEIILTVCFKWFSQGKSFDRESEEVESFIADGGVFGSLNENKGAVLTRRELQEGESGKAFLTRLHLAFPPYRKLKKLKYIKFIDGKPWLTPAAWLYRFAYTVKNRRDFTKKAVASIGEKETVAKAEKQLKFFEEIGLK